MLPKAMSNRLFSSSSIFITLTTTILVTNLITTTQSTTHPHDVQALKHLKRTINPSTIPPGACIESWDFHLDPCDSLFSSKFTCGFVCSSFDSVVSRVTELNLDSAGYSATSLGSVPFGHLAFLQILDFSNNNFMGSLPESISKLTNLTRLSLSHNSFVDSIPESYGELYNLQEMYLDNNMLNGQIPTSFNGLKNLKTLVLSNNRLTGGFPVLDEMGSLNFLDASGNNISGEIPTSLPPQLIELAARNNRISGNIPANLPTYLQVLDLTNNRLSGPIPSSLFTHPSLQQLTLSYNQLDSIQTPVDQSLTLASQLVSVDLSNNLLRGFLPWFMGSLPRLSSLAMENNMFSGLIPTQYVLRVLEPVGGLRRLLLGGNYLFGPIPGGFFGLDPGSVMLRLGDNCLYRCPVRWFFCEGGVQKSLVQCRAFGPIIP